MEVFSQKTQESIGFYVYLLINPLDNKIFYVGKGQKNRVFEHAKASLLDLETNDKLDIIREIIAKGQKVKYYILRHGLSEKEAFIVESSFIDFLTFRDFKSVANITNIIAGHHQWDKGIKSVGEIEQIYNCKLLDIHNKPHKLLCININKTYHRYTDIYEATRKSWVLNPDKANEADYVVAEYKGIIRAIFKVNSRGWYFYSKDQYNRYCFEGNRVEEKEICELYLDKKLPDKLKGSANPIRYLY
ncbi:LEM-3-like GIY-YIG domain-containing protein [Helicobacter cappadocius]|uniref:GIY-YIG domain-containing protein n=1 Tax=Helicobacter cappadocius TaxID=3063998 RepID=A0AA90TBT5_9HELI|nr:MULTISPECIES: hypothetical protein [unclassified Helicobacter]MDO7253197.1 hypothetical protein [Helicobacter sp. faydin-H75]MDP2539121.1 hypothetical protein [Helicobacter sp. faydin-H76]